MSYQCLDCGIIFNEIDAAVNDKYVGEYSGMPAYEHINCCPRCGGDCEELIPCVVCGNEHREDDMHSGICEDCITMHGGDIDLCLKIGDRDKEDVEINSFIAHIFDEETINRILTEYVSEYSQNPFSRLSDCCESYMNECIEWFCELWAEEKEKEEML